MTYRGVPACVSGEERGDREPDSIACKIAAADSSL